MESGKMKTQGENERDIDRYPILAAGTVGSRSTTTTQINARAYNNNNDNNNNNFISRG